VFDPMRQELFTPNVASARAEQRAAAVSSAKGSSTRCSDRFPHDVHSTLDDVIGCSRLRGGRRRPARRPSICWVAAGRGRLLERSLQPWDTAPALLVEEAAAA
jgi:fructose-1,6-bisphosphatase/inositol monophosphatase family enzyme